MEAEAVMRLEMGSEVSEEEEERGGRLRRQRRPGLGGPGLRAWAGCWRGWGASSWAGSGAESDRLCSQPEWRPRRRHLLEAQRGRDRKTD